MTNYRAKAYIIARRVVNLPMKWVGYNGGNHVFQVKDGSKVEVDLVLEKATKK